MLDKSICRKTNWSEECETQLNIQILKELQASFVYHILFSYFNRDNIGYKNIANYFNECSLEEREHAHKLMEYQNLRGGKVILHNGLESFNNEIFDTLDGVYNKILSGFELALTLEQDVYEHLLILHKIADKNSDPQFSDFIEGEYLKEQITAINEIGTYISQLTNIGDNGYGLWNFDKSFEK